MDEAMVRRREDLGVVAVCDRCGETFATALAAASSEHAVALVRDLLRDLYGWTHDALVDLCGGCSAT
ncbi:hypothetical protein DW322_08610 [Rhodococcus rhodnii]|uniref:Uncharacterized protein n=2 Tax=Rhodococcus rhodnii TaxID=38312 RepID=R7WKC2_9NOCA|nr:hypothetical protein [Rhodococcus rhodnii]EOM75766.1 hypothetical protein Rrhod_2898 [Rhodococcus rhodnii LMG 5362]TXG90271.1 hypothetical protein DW322_08610 [Rhodococcus rhodnii]